MNDRWELFQKFMITESMEIKVEDLLINSILVVLFSLILEYTYSKCAKSISNRKLFANNFMLITFTTMVIITIVKSSLALSLGLVGALSIVRFRAAIKEPEELAYLFFTISVGLGLGANQIVITSVAFLVLILMVWGRHLIRPRSVQRNLFVTLRSPRELDMAGVDSLVNEHFRSNKLKRLEEGESGSELSYQIDAGKQESLLAFKQSVKSLGSDIHIGFIDVES